VRNGLGRLLGCLAAALPACGGGGASAQHAPRAILDRTQLDFGPVPVGKTSSRSILLTNDGAASLPLPSIAARGAYSQTNDCGASLAVGASCTIAVTFAPGAAGPSPGLITIGVGAAASPMTVPLSGAGVYDGVLTQHNDQARSGQYPETVLTPASVSPAAFGKLASFPVDGQVYAQPLLARSVDVPGHGVHDVLYVATEHDTLLAFDASGLGSTPLWSRSFLASPGVVPVPSADLGCTDLVPEIGITGTPVIDGTTGTLYLVARTKEAATSATPAYVQRLHALDLATGAEQPGSPVIIAASVPGTGDGGTQVAFDAFTQNQRAALLLSGGTVYVAFGSHCDIAPYHGWILGYDAATLARTVVFNDTPGGSMGGIWQSGAGPAADDAGDLYAISGNGTFDATGPVIDVGESFLELSPAGALLDYFTPFNQATLSANDQDLGSAGPLLLPDQPGPHPHLVVSAGKEGTIYLVDRDGMGHMQPGSDGQIVQSLVGALPGENDSAPAYWNGRVYFGAQGDGIRAFALTGGLLSKTPVSQTAETFPLKGGFPVISSDGDAGGLLWAMAVPGAGQPAVLRAYDASRLGTAVWSSDASGARDALGPAAKFATPIVSGGRVYVATRAGVAVFGQLR